MWKYWKSLIYYILILANNLTKVYHETVTLGLAYHLSLSLTARQVVQCFIGVNCVVLRWNVLTSAVGFRVQSFVGQTFIFSFFDIFFIYVMLWHQLSITFIGKLH